MMNLPKVKLGLIAVSRDCFPIELSRSRRAAVCAACEAAGVGIAEIGTCVENENDALKALSEARDAGCNALVVYLGNFGPEGPETLLAKDFCGPVMFAAAAEESASELLGNRGDAYCGMLNCSYNVGLRGLKNCYIPEYPVGSASEVAAMIADFAPIARAYIGVKNLKIFGFGPRPYDFLACNAPIKPFYELGATVQENSELDLFESFNRHLDDKRVADVVRDMEKELGGGNRHPGILSRLAALELTLLDWYENNLGASQYGVFANKCWPAFQTQFGCVPCYVNSRLTARGIPVACEVDLYGALSEYIIACVTDMPGTLLDINNTVPADMYEKNRAVMKDYKLSDLFMGFHCGNTASCLLKSYEMSHQVIMKRALEPLGEPNITRGTLEGTLISGGVTLFRVQGNADGKLVSYIAEGEVIDADPMSFGGIGIIAIPEMARFYRHVLIEKRFPHHGGVAFKRAGKLFFEVVKMLGVCDINYNRPKGLPYPTENPFA